ncbi:RNA polymerase sigma factor [Streptococcus suis]|uniref:RNA polymerase sigma factor n=1 Tax=Streptococcus suis TaxID=1307 RepID=UPI00049255BA|nr:sigma-70 family RNA polymerase sigma factor [Streptococcus suis]ASW51309.1 RNA polymerase subunit sigma-70 [Streptococcus suis]KPA70227.1 RNA polymerase subunit sigma-70 [Streptococcus suis]MBS8078711.1 sigma-70 family RNA polymerase sigma factor [Streptococcus suis]MCK3964299.1 sigma-70 family RNA polymerase sigma factor [Streptococcus suis]MCK3972871.1 sigma-70 family RNA polymerase sigma factor [Streptococcus suis]
MSIKLDQYEKEIIGIAEEISYYLQKSGATFSDSQDIAQDVLVKILEAELVLPFDKLRAWLYRSAVRAYIDKYRRDKRYHEILQKEFFTPENFLVYDQEDYEELYQAVADLPAKYQHVIDLYYFQDMSVKEIAHILGYSQSLVKINLYRGRKLLAKNLKEKGYEYENF